MTLDDMATQLQASADYRVVRRLTPVARYQPDVSGEPLRRALLVDVETTGLDTARDAIIEFGAVPFTYDSAGRVHTVGEPVAYFEDPGRPIPADVQAITRITDEMVAGKRIDDARVSALLADTGLVIAHNASFDRRVLERRLPAFEQKHWACSREDVPWDRFGATSTKLDYLLYLVCGSFHDGHRAVDDCRATIHLLALPRDKELRAPMTHLLERARRKSCRVWARRSLFETKELLKTRGYRWSDRQKTWYIDRAPAELDEEKSWLAEHVYAGNASPPFEVSTFTSIDRYSDRT